MINVFTENGKIKVACGKASGYDLISEAIAACVSVTGTISTSDGEKECKEDVAKEVFMHITVGIVKNFQDRYGVDLLGDDDSNNEDDDDDGIIAKAIPVDSDTGRKLMELLGINPDEEKSEADDETEDDLPDFLF